MKQLNVFLEDIEYMALVEQKGNRTWKEFLLYMSEELKKK